MKNVLLADDHSVLRAGLKSFIGYHVPHAVIDEAWDGASAFEKVKEKDYQLMILDVNMPATDSFGLVSNIISLKPESNILMFSMNTEAFYAKKYLQLGAKGYLNKEASEEEIKRAVDKVIQAKRYISASLAQLLTEEALGGKSSNPFDNLSVRELEVALYLIRGHSSAEIGEILCIHRSTVSTFKARIFEKLKSNNIIDLTALAKVYNVSPAS